MANIEKRKTSNNETTYRVKIRLKGHPTQTATFKRLTDAKIWTQQTESAIREGRYFKTSEAKKHTLAEAIDRYLQNILPKKSKSMSDQTTQFTWWKDTIGHKMLADVTPPVIAEQRDILAKGITVRNKQRSAATVNRYLAALSHLFTIATKEWGWINENPLQKISKMKEPRGRVRFLSDAERNKLLTTAKESTNPYLYLIIVICLSTGARKMEILNLRWSDVDLNRGVIILHETKNNERRVLPITGHALELIKQHSEKKQNDTELLFPGKNKKQPMDIRTPWETILKKAEIEDFRFHDLRHSAASYLAMNDASLAEIAEVLGHKTLQMVKRYAHLSEAHTAKIVAKMNERIFG